MPKKKNKSSLSLGLKPNSIAALATMGVVAAVGIFVLTFSHASSTVTSHGGSVISLPDGVVTIGAASPNNLLDASLTFAPNTGSTDALNQGYASLKDCPDTTLRNCNFVAYSNTVKPEGSPVYQYDIVTQQISPKATDMYEGCGNYNIGWGKYIGTKCENGEMWNLANFTPLPQSAPDLVLQGVVAASACSVSHNDSSTTLKVRGVRKNANVWQMGVVYGPKGANPAIVPNSYWVSEYGQHGTASVTQVTVPNSDQISVWFSVLGQLRYWTNATSIPSGLVACN